MLFLLFPSLAQHVFIFRLGLGMIWNTTSIFKTGGDPSPDANHMENCRTGLKGLLIKKIRLK
jgi:hypothetical protein